MFSFRPERKKNGTSGEREREGERPSSQRRCDEIDCERAAVSHITNGSSAADVLLSLFFISLAHKDLQILNIKNKNTTFLWHRDNRTFN